MSPSPSYFQWKALQHVLFKDKMSNLTIYFQRECSTSPPLNPESQEPQSELRGQFSPGPQPGLIAPSLQRVLPNVVKHIPGRSFRSAVGCLQSTKLGSLTFFNFSNAAEGRYRQDGKKKISGGGKKLKITCGINFRTIWVNVIAQGR